MNIDFFKQQGSIHKPSDHELHQIKDTMHLFDFEELDELHTLAKKSEGFRKNTTMIKKG